MTWQDATTTDSSPPAERSAMDRTTFGVPVPGIRPRAASPLTIANGTLEALKWLGLVLMTLDHVNKYLLAGSSWVLFDLGRLVMPVFGFVLMYRLAHADTPVSGVHARVARRLLIVGIGATPVFVALGGWWPLNILFTLLLATGIVRLLGQGGVWRWLAAVTAVAIGGAGVEFGWFGVLACVGAWAYCRQPTPVRLACWAAALASLWGVNGNFAALAALPLIWGATRVTITLARWHWAFYAYYPLHLALIWLATRLH